jgi:hypothetical protein
MSIHDLIEKINGSALSKPKIDPPPAKVPFFALWAIAIAILLGLSGWGMAIYLLEHIRAPTPVQIECSEDILKSLEATTSLRTLKEQTPAPKPKKEKKGKTSKSKEKK